MAPLELGRPSPERHRPAEQYVLVMLAVGAVYLVGLLACPGRGTLALPDMHRVDTELDRMGRLA